MYIYIYIHTYIHIYILIVVVILSILLSLLYGLRVQLHPDRSHTSEEVKSAQGSTARRTHFKYEHVYVHMFMESGATHILRVKGVLGMIPLVLRIGANYSTPEIDTSESIVDLQWHFPMNVQWDIPTYVRFSVACSKGLSLLLEVSDGHPLELSNKMPPL